MCVDGNVACSDVWTCEANLHMQDDEVTHSVLSSIAGGDSSHVDVQRL